jgi:hypothetical protein
MKRKLMIAVMAALLVSTFAFLSTPPSAWAQTGGMMVGVDYWSGSKASNFLSKDAPLMRQAGLKILRICFEPSVMSNLASLVPAINSSKLQILGVLYNRNLLSQNNIKGWGDWVYNTVSAYKKYVKVWQVWNEPDWNTGFGNPGDAVKYTSWLKAAYPRAKQADPTCRLIGGGISCITSSTLNFLTTMYKNGAKSYMDAVSVDPYCSNLSPLPPAQTSSGKAFWKTQNARNIMVQYGDAGKPMWITEMGWNTAGGGTRVTEAVQAQRLTDALNYAKKNWSWLEAFIIYQWQDGSTWQYGLLRSDGKCKPAFNAVKTFISNNS